MTLEICANSYQSALYAEYVGAQRIELCSELAVGGITPSYGLLKKVMNKMSIPVHVLIRPRSGDFMYSNAEFEIMKRNIELCKELGCAGIVIGILRDDFMIDLERMYQLTLISKPLSFTFHRAFDWIPNPKDAIKDLISLGINRVLTSGQEDTAEKGIGLLKELQEIAGNDLIVMPGGGINPENAGLFKEQGFKEIHCSAIQSQQTIPTPKISMNSPKLISDTHILVSNPQKIRQILQRIQSKDD